MTPEEFRHAGHVLIDWIADYRQSIQDRPVRTVVEPGDTKSKFDSAPPKEKASIESLIAQLDELVVPAITQVQHPMHFGWFPSNAALSSVLGDIASSGLGTLGISWESCPALTELEEVVCDWMRQLTGLSDQWHGSITDTASTACLTAMLAAREKASHYSAYRGGLVSQNTALTVYTTEEAHSSVQKAVLLAGFGKDNLRLVEMNPYSRTMDTRSLADTIREDIESGKKPAAVIASVGSTGVTAIDPVEEMANIARSHGMWLHIDAAMAGSAMLLPECRWMWHGCEQADSISWNPHKWMGTILDCSLLYVSDTEHLIRVMSNNPSYLRSSADGRAIQYRDWGIPLGRRFRALKLWFHLAIDGQESIRHRLRRDLDNARWLAGQIEQTPGWELVAPVNLQTVCVRHYPARFKDQKISDDQMNAYTLGWVNRINKSGEAFLTPAKLDGSWMVRVSIGVESTSRTEVELLWELMQRYVRN